MSDENKARLAHDVLDGLSAGRILSRENEQLLRSFLPELPKQMTLEEIYKYVDDAWLEADDPELKEWLHELHAQLKGLEVAHLRTSWIAQAVKMIRPMVASAATVPP